MKKYPNTKLTIEVIETISPDPADETRCIRGYAMHSKVEPEDPTAKPYDESILPVMSVMVMNAMRLILAHAMGSPVDATFQVTGPDVDPDPGRTIERMVEDYQTHKLAETVKGGH